MENGNLISHGARTLAGKAEPSDENAFDQSRSPAVQIGELLSQHNQKHPESIDRSYKERLVEHPDRFKFEGPELGCKFEVLITKFLP